MIAHWVIETSTTHIGQQPNGHLTSGGQGATHGAHAVNLLWSNRLEHFVELGVEDNPFSIAMARVLGAQTYRCPSQPTFPADRWSDHACDIEYLKRIVALL